MPVAFATNAMYILARNGMIQSNNRVVAEKLIPLLHQKKDYLHGEGVAQAVYALEQAENYDQETWALLKEKIEAKDFNYIVVKNDRRGVLNFETHSGTEHLVQGDNDQFTNDLFYSGKLFIFNLTLFICFLDKLNFYELYNSVKAVNERAPELQLGSTIEALEKRYANLLDENELYLTLSQEKYAPKFLLEDENNPIKEAAQ